MHQHNAFLPPCHDMARPVPVQISQPLAPLVDEFAQRLFRELDYVEEGRSAEHFQRLYADVPRVRRCMTRISSRDFITYGYASAGLPSGVRRAVTADSRSKLGQFPINCLMQTRLSCECA